MKAIQSALLGLSLAGLATLSAAAATIDTNPISMLLVRLLIGLTNGGNDYCGKSQ